MTHSEISLSARSWTLRCLTPDRAPMVLPDAVPAQVPGCVHTDLLAAGLIPDPYLDTNEADQHWIGHSTWLYATKVILPALPGQPIELVCDGLDTVATIRLNGVEVGATANMHRRFRFELADAARAGENDLEIEFASAWDYAKALECERGELPNAYVGMPFNYVRKMACNFGWDWGPTLVTAGIWRPIRIELGDPAPPTAQPGDPRPRISRTGDLQPRISRMGDLRPRISRMGDLRPQATWTDCGAHLVVTPELVEQHEELRVRVTGPGLRSTEFTGYGEIDVIVPDARPWWPHSMGDQPLYDVEVSLLDNGSVVLTHTVQVGFRTVTLVTSADEIGRRFAFAINGTELFVRGANWIPDDCFPSRVDAARYAERIGQAKDANIDLLRVWGGGIYESEDFYAACDEAGILVWQDFLFACAAYPEEEPIRAEVIAEATDNVSRLMPHPSLVLWNGNNENIWGHADWDWADQIGDRTWGAGYYFDLLPKIVAELDPARPYWPGSPWSGDGDVAPNAMTHGCSHIWDVWNTRDYTGYAEHAPRFAAEFGFQGPPTWTTLTQAVHDRPLSQDSAGFVAHEKAADGLAKLNRGLAPHLPVPTDFADWHFATQLNQARAVAYGIRHHRSLRGRCMGSVVWQLNDCWPVSSWAALDSGTTPDGNQTARRKPLWYALREVFADHLLVAGDGAVILVNDSPTDWAGTLAVTSHATSDVVRAEPTEWPGVRVELAFNVGARSRTALDLPQQSQRAGDAFVTELVTTTGERLVAFDQEDIDLDLPPAGYTIRAEPVADDTVAVTVTAQTLLRSVCLFADRVHPLAEAETMIVDLLPGQSHTFTVHGPPGFASEVAADAWRDPHVVRTVNDLIHPPATRPATIRTPRSTQQTHPQALRT